MEEATEIPKWGFLGGIILRHVMILGAAQAKPSGGSKAFHSGSVMPMGAQGGALLSSLSAIAMDQIVLDMAIKGVSQALSIHDKTLEEATKTVWDSMIGMDATKLILTTNATALKTEMTHAKVMGQKEALDEARNELMEVKNDLREARNELMEVKNDVREVKAVVGPPKFPPPSSGGGSSSGGGGGNGSGSDGEGWQWR
ncbi:hypothetical protein CMV_018636 [Castanea mollissima]|uniref:Uncharacterized protein n=1 Tax=Castanea mollissima TaxID=60419 RepID=A0A8J4QZP0_9ROSI|nr:hypothetical protein CMV_018636 [Castanea mollissima]